MGAGTGLDLCTGLGSGAGLALGVGARIVPRTQGMGMPPGTQGGGTVVVGMGVSIPVAEPPVTLVLRMSKGLLFDESESQSDSDTSDVLAEEMSD